LTDTCDWGILTENGDQWFFKNFPSINDGKLRTDDGVLNLFVKFNLGNNWENSLHQIIKDINGNFKLLLPVLEVDDKVYVRDDESEPWKRKHFTPDGEICVFCDGSSWTNKDGKTEYYKYFVADKHQ